MAFKDLTGQFSRIFRADNEASTPGVATPGSQDAPATAADADLARQIAAVQTMPDGPSLRTTAGLVSGVATPGVVTPGVATPNPPPSHATPIAVIRAAQARLAALVDAGTVDFDALRAQSGASDALLCVAELCKDPAVLTTAFAAIDDLARVEWLVHEGPTTHIRQLAAHRIEDPVVLKRLIKDVRGKDKNVYKIIRHKTDDLRAEELRIEKLDQDVTALGAALERHGRRAYDATYEASLRIYLSEWKPLETAVTPEVRERVQAAIEQCRAVIAEHEHQLAEQAAKLAHEAAVKQTQEEARQRAEEEAQLRAAEAAQAAAEAAQQREAAAQSQAALMAEAERAVRNVASLIGKANAALREGNTGRAASVRRTLAEKLESGPPLPNFLVTQVQQLDEKLASLKEWKDYAVAPKRAELIQEMESLVGSTEDPKVLAERIRQLREEWSTISKGIISNSEADWQRFHQADVAAYQPCREYFEAQSKIRHENLERRRSVLQRVKAFAATQSGTSPDWRAIAQVLREARPEFQRHSPVDRSPGAALMAEFNQALDGLQTLLDAWHEHNSIEKKALIQRAQGLVNKVEGREAVDGVKHLQQLWKEIGQASRAEDQKLWNEFRGHCDAVFQKRDQAHAAQVAGLAANKARAVALCENVEALTALTGAELLSGIAKIAGWRTEWDSVGELPRGDDRALRDRFERAARKCQSSLTQERAREKENAFQQLLDAVRRINAYGHAKSQSASSDEQDRLKKDAEEFISGIGTWHKNATQALKAAWTKAESAAAAAYAANEKLLKVLCIRGEILAELATPPEDQALRREYQVQQLMQRMGQHTGPTPDEVDAMVFEWAAVGPVPPAAHEALLERFRRNRAALKSRSA